LPTAAPRGRERSLSLLAYRRSESLRLVLVEVRRRGVRPYPVLEREYLNLIRRGDRDEHLPDHVAHALLRLLLVDRGDVTMKGVELSSFQSATAWPSPETSCDWDSDSRGGTGGRWRRHQDRFTDQPVTTCLESPLLQRALAGTASSVRRRTSDGRTFSFASDVSGQEQTAHQERA